MKILSKDERGYALLATIFIVILITSGLTGSFLNMTRQGRSIQKFKDRSEMNGYAQTVVAAVENLFYDYVIIHSTYPGFSPDNNREVCDPCTSSGEVFFKDRILGRIPFLTTEMSFVKNPANISLDPEIRVRQVGDSTDPADAVREYEVMVAMVNTRSGERLAIKQKLEVRTGTLFDFSIFYDDDLEIAPGPESSIQGPIFTNGDIYLMSGKSSDFATNAGLKLLLPFSNPSNPHPQKYILKSHGDIYFYFKRAMAENYMLNSQEFSGADVYIANLPSYYFEALGVGNIAALEAKVANGDKLPEITPPWNVHQSDWCDYSKTYAGCQLENLETENRFFPYFYYFSNGAELGSYTGSLPATRISLYDSTGTSSLGILVQSYSRFSNSAIGTVYHAPRMGPYYYPYTQYRISISPAFDVTNFPELYSNWSPEHPVATRKNVTGETHPLKEKMDNPLKDPQWHGIGSGDSALIMDNVDIKALPLGVANPDPLDINPNHLLIEPSKISIPPNPLTDDSPETLKLKYQYNADINVRCKDSACVTYEVCLKGANPSCSGASNFNFVDITSSIYDYRLIGSYRTLTLYMDKLREYFLDNLPGTDADGTAFGNERFRDGVSVYVQTLPMLDSQGVPQGNAEGNSVRLVRVKDSPTAAYPGAIPSALQSETITGLTIATNGRLWVQGDFNTYFGYSASGIPEGVCTYDNIINQACKVPPAAIFSDSFGILSSQWEDTHGPSTSLDNRNVTNDIHLNAAIVTGFLESSLRRKYSTLPEHSWHQQFPFLPSDLTGPDAKGLYYLNTSTPDFDQAKSASSWWPEWAKAPGAKIPVVTCDVDKANNPVPLVPVQGCKPFVGVPSVRLYYKHYLTGYTDKPINCHGGWGRILGSVPSGEPGTIPINDWGCLESDTPGAPTRYADWRSFACREGITFEGAMLPSESPYLNLSCRITADPLNPVGKPTEIYNAWRLDVSSNPSSEMISARPNKFTGLLPGVTVIDSKSNNADPSDDLWAQDKSGNLIYKVLNATAGAPGGQLKSGSMFQFYLFCPYGICSNDYPELRNRNGSIVNCSGLDPNASTCTSSGWSFSNSYKPFLEPLYEKLQIADQHGNPLYWYSWNGSWASPGMPYRNFVIVKLVNPYPAGSIDPSSPVQVPEVGKYYFKNWTCHPASGNCSSGSGKIYLRECDFAVLEGSKTAIFVPSQQPILYYAWHWYERLYDAKYSGGYENLINFQENWRDLSDTTQDIRRKVFFSGVTTAPWFSEELKTSGGSPAYYETGYYRAPERTYDYNEALRDDPPPGTPKLFSVTQETIQKEVDPDDVDHVDPVTP